MKRLLPLLLLVAAPGIASHPPTVSVQTTAGAAAAFEVGGCTLCHSVPSMEPAAQVDSCQGCHVWIRKVASVPAAREKAIAAFPKWERYEQNVASYMEVPSLEAAMVRLDPEWVGAYLQDPHDLRPGLPETMPRFDLSSEQVDAIVAAFSASTADVPATPEPSAANLAAGEALFQSKGCVACHTLGTAGGPGIPMAPDLAHTRTRMDPDHVAAWIDNPQTMSAEATMPRVELSEAERLAVRDYVMLAPLDTTEQPALAQTVAPMKKAVTWTDVEAQVFGKICVHCHMDPSQNDGRRGPGNAGGFGWAATDIELQTYEGVAAVADRIPAALERRRVEAHRDVVSAGHHPASVERPERPGMPLGLPPLSDKDTALVLGWNRAGHAALRSPRG